MSLFPCLTTEACCFQSLALGSVQCTKAAQSPVLFNGIYIANTREHLLALHQVLEAGERGCSTGAAIGN